MELGEEAGRGSWDLGAESLEELGAGSWELGAGGRSWERGAGSSESWELGESWEELGEELGAWS